MDFNKKEEMVWNLSSMFDGDDDPKMQEERKEISKATEEFVSKWGNRNDWLEDPLVLLEALDDYERFARIGSTGNQGYYLGIRQTQDQSNPNLKAKLTKLEDFAQKISDKIRFFGLKLSKVAEEKQKIFLEDNGLKKYNHFLERTFVEGKHVLSEPEEKIMEMKSTSAYSNWIQMVDELLGKEEREILNEKGEKEKVTYEQLITLAGSHDEKVREEAAKNVNEILAKIAPIAEVEINSILQDKKVNDELRGFDRPDAARHLEDDVEAKTVDTLIEAVVENYDLSHKVFELKCKLNKLDKLPYYARRLSYGAVNKDYSYGDAVNLCDKVFKRLDPKFDEIFQSFLKNGQIDVYPRKGKRGGAFCAGESLSVPTLVLLNHTEKLRDVTTLAHEMGHAINNEIMKEVRHELDYDVPKSTAEVASIFMEDFVLEEVLKDSDDELKLAILMEKIYDFVGSCSRQISCYRFEQDLHREYREKGFLSKEDIGELFLKNMKAYMGDYVSFPEGSENWWVYWWHIRTYFYVYSYAGGILISQALQEKVRVDPSFIEEVKVFLAAGLSDSPRNIFLKMGIDIDKKEFWQQGLDKIRKLIDETEQLAKKMGKI
jgi:oligoendopeptidase F